MNLMIVIIIFIYLAKTILPNEKDDERLKVISQKVNNRTANIGEILEVLIGFIKSLICSILGIWFLWFLFKTL